MIHPVHLRIIEEATRFLSDADAAKADAILAEGAPGQTYGELRYAARKLVLKLDPDTDRKRKEAARREAHVRRFQEESGNAGMVARELPSDEVLASWQHIEQRALDLRAAGLPGTLQELRVQAYLDLLQERDTRTALADPRATGAAGQDQPGPDQPPDSDPPGPSGPPSTGPDGPGGNSGPGGSSGPGGPGGLGPAPRSSPYAGPSLAALVTITMPLTTYQGQSEAQGDAAAHACLPSRHLRPATRPPITGPPGIHSTPLTPITHGPCDHAPRPGRLPPLPDPGSPGPRSQRYVHRSGLRPPRRSLRPGPHHRVGQGRPPPVNVTWPRPVCDNHTFRADRS